MMKKLFCICVLIFAVLLVNGQTLKTLPMKRALSNVYDQTARDAAQDAQDSIAAVRDRYFDILSVTNDSVYVALDQARAAFRIADSLARLGTVAPVGLQKKDILHDMIACIPGEAVANDYVIEVNPNENWRPYQSLIYGIENNAYFKLESGIIKLATNSVPVGDYTVDFTVSDSVFTDTASVSIKVVDPSLCYYVDPTSTGTGVGSKANPYKTIGFSLSTGRYYFFKRGTTTTSTSPKGLVNDVLFGAYGAGNRPIIRNTASSTFMLQSYYKTNVTLRDLDIEDAGSLSTSNVYVLGSTNFNFINNKLHGNVNTFQGLRIFTTIGGCIRDNEIYNFRDDNVFIGGLEGTSSADWFDIVGNYSHHPNLGVVTLGTGANGDCMQISADSRHRRLYLAYNNFDHSATDYKHCLVLGCELEATDITDVEMICEYNLFITKQVQTLPQNALSICGIRGAHVRYNEMWYGHRNIFDFETDANQNVKIYGNLLVEGKTAGIQFNGVNSDNVEVYNNTFVNNGNGTVDAVHGTILMNGSQTGVVFKNNIFYNTNSSTLVFVNEPSFTEDYNLFYPNNNGLSSIGSNSSVGNPLFVKGDHSSYEIGTNSPAYHSGQAISGITTGLRDVFGVPWHSTPSRGYKEKQ